MRARRSALRRRQGRRRGRSALSLHEGAREPVAPLHAGNDSLRRTADGRDGAGSRHQRAGDGLVHGHLFHVSGDHGAGDRHGQASQLGRREATGHGVAFLAFRALETLGIPAAGTTAIVQGFGNVGSHAALGLAARGVRIVGVSDHTVAYYDPKGFDVTALVAHAERNRELAGYSSQATIEPRALLEQPCDVLAPCAVERVIDADLARRLRCRIIAEGANGPTTPEADRVLAERNDGIFVIPDILCNAGGVIVSYFEWVQDLQQYFWSKEEVIDRLERALDRSWAMVDARARRDGISGRMAAMAIGVERVRKAKQMRGLFP
jgi:glutamate dehydrogenase (NAD(P)+)